MHTIEYIGPHPKKPTKRSWVGAWLMVAMVVVGVTVVAKNFADKALANYEKVTELKVEETVAWLSEGDAFGNQLAMAALERTKKGIFYDSDYYEISYPNGDIPEGRGASADLVIRSYRALGTDLQELVHNDMTGNFRIYPQLWSLRKPDSNIDHRRVPNLQRFFSRQGAEIEVDSEAQQRAEDFDYGDVVTWRLAGGQTHIGIVVPGPGDLRDEKWIVHNIGGGPKWENSLLEYQVIGHYRYSGASSDS